eukprot:7244376-Prymnesium_polylepis.1
MHSGEARRDLQHDRSQISEQQLDLAGEGPFERSAVDIPVSGWWDESTFRLESTRWDRGGVGLGSRRRTR